MKQHDPLVALAALSGAVAVIAGAFGAHAISGAHAEWFKTGAQYQMIHAVAALVVAGRSGSAARAGWCFVIGGAVFAGTLYAMALGLPHWLGAVTPAGGLLMIAGWLLLAAAAVS
jgi:uncharacterized membrane protein YgdD (TMEM256/DUF423 family)